VDSAVRALEDMEGFEDLRRLRVAISHYWLVTWRGGEKVLASMLKLFPKADIYTLFYEPKVCGPYLKGHKVYPSAINGLRNHHQLVFPLYPYGQRSLKLKGDYDLILSSESGPAKGIANPSGIPHLCYIHTPMRYCWVDRESYLARVPRLLRPFAELEFERLKQWDLQTVEGPDLYVANSLNVAKRVEQFYGKSANICYPPIDLGLFEAPLTQGPQDFYLSFGALTPYKRVDLLVEAFNRSGKKLKVIGDGSEMGRLRAQAQPNIQFLGALDSVRLDQEIKGAKALLFPGDEDFGMVPLELMARGIPVIALAKGGALETVKQSSIGPEASTGIFYPQDNLESLELALETFERSCNRFNPQAIRDHARRFGEDRFLACLATQVRALLNR